MRLTVYFDSTCPYSFAAAVWLRQLEQVKSDLTVEWRSFLLREANRPAGEGVPVWEDTRVTPARTGLAFIGRRSAARHAPIAADTFRLVLQSALQIEHPDPSSRVCLRPLRLSLGSISPALKPTGKIQ